MLRIDCNIVEAFCSGKKALSLAIPKIHIKNRGLNGKDQIYVTSKKEKGLLIIEVTEYYQENSYKRKIIKSGDSYRFTIPKAIKGHNQGCLWDAYADPEGLLRYENALRNK